MSKTLRWLALVVPVAVAAYSQFLNLGLSDTEKHDLVEYLKSR